MTTRNGKLYIIIIDIDELWERKIINNEPLNMRLCNICHFAFVGRDQ